MEDCFKFKSEEEISINPINRIDDQYSNFDDETLIDIPPPNDLDALFIEG